MLRQFSARLAAPLLTSPKSHTPAPSLTLLLHRLSTLPRDSSAAPKTNAPPSRWQLLKRKRREAPKPQNRTAYQFDHRQPVSPSEALTHVRAASWANFDESLELVFRLNIDPRKAPENIRGVIQLPHGTGRQVRVAAFAEGLEADQAMEAGAQLVGGEDLINQIRTNRGKPVKGFDACVAVPELLPLVASSVGRILGPKGLMPSKKDSTVGTDVADMVTQWKTSLTKYRTDRNGNVHLIVGKLSFDDNMLIENICAATSAIMNARPQTLKKKYMQKAHLCSSMGPSVMLDLIKLAQVVSHQQA